MIKKNYPYLKDTAFLEQICSLKHITHYAKIITLNWNEYPLKEIQGQVTNGSVSINGDSLVRRTANLNLSVKKFNSLSTIRSQFSINKKIFLEVGIKNTTFKYSEYDIIWFPMGIYIIQNASCSKGADGISVSLQLQDKMCLLNGECGGTIPAAATFDTIESINYDGTIALKKVLIIQIIQEVVNHFGKIPLDQIIISDVPNQIKKVAKWSGSAPLYILKKGSQFNVTTNPNQVLNRINQGFANVNGSPFSYGADIGYIYEDFTYPGELVCDAGASVCDILSKITTVLSNYEYFFDVFGNFIFQQKRNYLNNSQFFYFKDKIKNQGGFNLSDYILDLSHGKSVYQFKNSELILSYTNSPQYNKIKNDFVVWGQDKNTKRTVRYHLAIDEKPTVGNKYVVFRYIDPIDDVIKWTLPLSFPSLAEFPKEGIDGAFYYATSFHKLYIYYEDEGYKEINSFSIAQVTTKDWRTQLYFQGIMAQPYGAESNDYYAELKNQWPLIYNIVPDSNDGENYSGFKQDVLDDPSSLSYFLDFIDVDKDSKISQFSVGNIGRRSYVVSKDDINCVFEPDIPEIILINGDNGSDKRQDVNTSLENGNDYYILPDSIYSLLDTGGSFNSAYEHVRQLLHEYTSYNESISLTCIPLYFLEPNTRIFVQDEDSDIYGDYLISSINIGLGAGDTMSINAIKALERI